MADLADLRHICVSPPLERVYVKNDDCAATYGGQVKSLNAGFGGLTAFRFPLLKNVHPVTDRDRDQSEGNRCPDRGHLGEQMSRWKAAGRAVENPKNE